ncbi:MAG TPA: 50S ribosomal protein L11 methyltransferase [Gemmatimonadaceae bacterium]|nr:50S ribosomal protein L11 methyltransferase [Gemmatimonadaceae bacterium]
MSWIAVRVDGVADTDRPAVIEALVGAGAQGVQEVGSALLTHLDSATDVGALEGELRRCANGMALVWAPDPSADRAVWEPQVGVHRVGRVAVAPPWRAAEVPPDAIPILIDPSTAFGTGEHESTRGALELLQGTLRIGDRVADLGTGSAILGIAAAKLGASRVIAIEIDEQAMGNAEDNIARNGVADRVTVFHGDASVFLPLLAPVDLVIANIISTVIIDLSPIIRDALRSGGRVVIGGMLRSERSDVAAALGADGWEIRAEHTEGDWWSSVIEPR